jgi:predicted metal-dependent hydrolase
LRKYYKAETAKYVKKYLAKYAEEFDIESPKITYRFYKSKWGSCSAKNDFSFNALLSMAPEKVIEYVVIHEFCHCRQKNHSKNFWYEVCKFDLNYKIHRKWLRENHHQMSL